MRAVSIGLEKPLYRRPYSRPEIVLACHLCRWCTPLIIIVSVTTGMHALRNSSRKLCYDPVSLGCWVRNSHEGICLAGTVVIVGKREPCICDKEIENYIHVHVPIAASRCLGPAIDERNGVVQNFGREVFLFTCWQAWTAVISCNQVTCRAELRQHWTLQKCSQWCCCLSVESRF